MSYFQSRLCFRVTSEMVTIMVPCAMHACAEHSLKILVSEQSLDVFLRRLLHRHGYLAEDFEGLPASWGRSTLTPPPRGS